MRRRIDLDAIADDSRVAHGGSFDGVASVASYQMTPRTSRPIKIRGISRTAKTNRFVTIALTENEARKMISDVQSFLD